MEKHIKNANVDNLCDAILNLKDREDVCNFFEDLCTKNEIFSMAQRFEVAKMLYEHQTYQKISETTGASTATISRVNRMLSEGNGTIPRLLSAD